MKMFAVCSVICAVGFFATAMQLGLLGNQQVEEEAPGEPAPVEKKAAKKVKRALFPDELAPAAKAQAGSHRRGLPARRSFAQDRLLQGHRRASSLA